MEKPQLNLFDLSPASVWRTDVTGSFEYFNRNWLDFTGRSMAQESGDGWTAGIHPEDRTGFFREFRAASNEHLPFEIEYRLRRKDGEYRWIQNIGRPFWNEGGEFAGYVGYCFDRTEQHETEEILRKLSRAVEQGTNSIVITDTAGCIEYVNASYTRLSGYGLDDLIGANPRSTPPGVNLPDVFGDSWETLQKGGEWRGEMQVSRKGGEPYWEFTTVSPITNADDVITHYLVVKEDITARKNAERELTKSRAELSVKHEELKFVYEQVARSQKEWENSMDCIGDIVILADSQGKMRRCNRALAEFTATAYPEILKAPWREFLARHGLMLPNDSFFSSEIYHEQSGRWFVCQSYPFTTSDSGEVQGTVVTIHDFTERKRVSGELEKAYSELKSTQAKVVQQEKMASIGQLAAGVAHEINNPMGFISSNLGTLGKYIGRLTEFIAAQAELIESTADEASLRTLMEKAHALKIGRVLEDGKALIEESLEGAQRVRTIVQNLKGFARVDEAEHKPADINECIESTINIVWNELKYKVNLVRELGEIPLTLCYPQQLNQVFMNLLVNAGQAIAERGEIVVKTWHDNGSIFASFTDSGCGMSAQVQQRIFEPFFTTKEVGQGTGLGMSISYDIIKNHNGEISIDSEPGKGSTFTVRLPVV
jgi:two-component system, NtrC family, sensor kinase